MLFISDRKPEIVCNFQQAVLKPIIDDGSLFVPSFIPKIDYKTIITYEEKNYKEMLIDIILKFWSECDNVNIVNDLVDNAFKNFNKNFIDDKNNEQHEYFDGYFSIDKFDDKNNIINFTYGPSGNVKDYGYCLTAEFVNYFSEKLNCKATIVNCLDNSSNISSAFAISNHSNLDGFVIINNKINNTTTGLLSKAYSNNLSYISVDDDFNFFENLNKNIINNRSLQEIKNISFINELNILNIIAYLPFFFKLYKQCNYKPFCISVPAGNLSLCISALIAKNMGIPIAKTILCVERNLFLLNFQELKIAKKYELDENLLGYSNLNCSFPSNFERLLFYLYNSDQLSVRRVLSSIKDSGVCKINDNILNNFLTYFYVSKTDNIFSLQNTISMMQKTKNKIYDIHFVISYTGYENSLLNLGSEISKYPVVFFNTMHYKRNIDFINNAIGYELQGITFPWKQEDVENFTSIQLNNNEEDILKYIINL